MNQLRQALRAHGLDAYIIPTSDPHQSEYVAEHWKGRQWISGFSGSAGIVVITQDHAGLWTDSRYFLQADNQLDGSEFVLHKQHATGTPEHVTWLAEHLPKGSTVGIDGYLFSVGQLRHLEKHLQPKGIDINTKIDLIAEIWKDRPVLPLEPIFEYDVTYAGESRADKLKRIREKMIKQGADFHLITTLDDIAWALNIRGKDVEANPVAISYLVVGKEMAYLFINAVKVPDHIKTNLNNDGVIIKSYDAIESFLQKLETPILVDDRSISVRLYEAIPEGQIIKGDNITLLLKSIKNPTEISHLREAMRKDGVALLRFFRWLEQELKTRTVTEFEAGRKLDEFRAVQGNYFGESFTAIVGYNANGAIVHYRPEEGSSAEIKSEGILLLDSGGQYLEGTTDITRTIALGTPTEEQKRHYTLVLKGHIALAKAKFPTGTTGVQLDTLARQFLWQQGLNFGHGTGHGVGFFLNVHEPPQGFTASPNNQRGSTPHEPGMLTSNEPGFYKTGEYGIRIENLVLCVEAEENDFGKFLQFDTLTLFLIDTTLIDSNLLTQEEKNWFNEYQHRVFNELAPRLDGEEVEWLRRKCDEI
ncbi:MAG: aminopeptidase P family protein [Saprospiraceae bacterium]